MNGTCLLMKVLSQVSCSLIYARSPLIPCIYSRSSKCMDCRVYSRKPSVCFLDLI
jgi:hypothetical protein